MTREILMIIISMVLISLNTSVFETHAQNASSSSPGGPGGRAIATAGQTVYCTVRGACYIVANATANANGGRGGNASTSFGGGGPATPTLIPAKVIPLDVVTLPYGAPVSQDTISTKIIKIPNDDTSRVRLAVTNTGDASVYDMTVNVFPGLQSPPGINGLTPSAKGSPNIPPPIVIVGHSTFYLGEIPANGIKELDVNVFPTVSGAVALPVKLTYNNAWQSEFCGYVLKCKGTNTPYSTVFRQVPVDVIAHR